MLLRVLFIHRTSGSKSEVFSSRIPAGTIWVADSRSDKLLHCLPLWWLMYIPYFLLLSSGCSHCKLGLSFCRCCLFLSISRFGSLLCSDKLLRFFVADLSRLVLLSRCLSPLEGGAVSSDDVDHVLESTDC